MEKPLKDVDLGEPTSFRDHVYLGCTQRECKPSKDIVDNYRNMFEFRMSAGGIEIYFIQRNLRQTFPHGPMTWKVMRRNAWKDCANWRTKRLNSYTKSQLHVLTTINSKKKNRICWRLIKSVFTNCPEMFIPGTYWKT